MLPFTGAPQLLKKSGTPTYIRWRNRDMKCRQAHENMELANYRTGYQWILALTSTAMIGVTTWLACSTTLHESYQQPIWTARRYYCRCSRRRFGVQDCPISAALKYPLFDGYTKYDGRLIRILHPFFNQALTASSSSFACV